MTEEEEKAIEELKKVDFDTLDDNICVNSMPILLNLIEKQQKEIEELNEEQEWRAEELENRIHELNTYKYRANENYIPKSKIKSHIYDLEQKKDIEDNALYTYSECISATIESFKSILESEE